MITRSPAGNTSVTPRTVVRLDQVAHHLRQLRMSDRGTIRHMHPADRPEPARSERDEAIAGFIERGRRYQQNYWDFWSDTWSGAKERARVLLRDRHRSEIEVLAEEPSLKPPPEKRR